MFYQKHLFKIKNHELVLGTLTTADINSTLLQLLKFDQSVMIDS